VTHTGRANAVDVARKAVDRLRAANLRVRLLAEEAAELGVTTEPSEPGPSEPGPSEPGPSDPGPSDPGLEVVPATPEAAVGCELVMVLGGDGSLLRGAELVRESGTPLLGVNLGHVGFLAEAEHEDLDVTVDKVVACAYEVEERMTLDVAVHRDGELVSRGWALNEGSVEKAARERMLEVVVEVDGRPLSRWGCDGVVCATPTGSTAYAFSAGGPVVWPEVDALLLVPISAHALFARPLVVSPRSVLAIEVLAHTEGVGVLWCDGRRSVELPPGARIEVRRGATPVRLARLHTAPFTDRLVAKFDLPVHGWRGGAERRRHHRPRDGGGSGA
jgi:NAD+ kinase